MWTSMWCSLFVDPPGEEADNFKELVHVAAEALSWVQVGLCTRQEVKEWDDEPQEIEQ